MLWAQIGRAIQCSARSSRTFAQRRGDAPPCRRELALLLLLHLEPSSRLTLLKNFCVRTLTLKSAYDYELFSIFDLPFANSDKIKADLAGQTFHRNRKKKIPARSSAALDLTVCKKKVCAKNVNIDIKRFDQYIRRYSPKLKELCSDQASVCSYCGPDVCAVFR